MRPFDLKQGWLIEHPNNREDAPGRTIHPEPMRLAETGWRGPNHRSGEHVASRECDIEDEQHRAAREWLWHVENGRIGG